MAREEETKELPNGPTGGAVLATHFVVLGIAALLILVRVVLRLRVQRGSLLVSDGLLFLAWGAAIATAAFDVVLYHHGLLMPYVTYGLKGWRPTSMQHLEYVLEVGFRFRLLFLLSLCVRLADNRVLDRETTEQVEAHRRHKGTGSVGHDAV